MWRDEKHEDLEALSGMTLSALTCFAAEPG